MRTSEAQKKILSVKKNSLVEIKNNLHGINSTADKTKNQISYLEYKEVKNNQSEQQEEKRIQKSGDSVRSLWDNFKHTNIQITGVPEGEEKSKKLRII